MARLRLNEQPKVAPQKDRDVLLLEENLAERLGAKVVIRANRKGVGRLSIEFASLEQLDELLNRIR